MRANRPGRIVALALVLGLVPQVWARLAGGGPRKSDCYVEWDGVTATLGTTVTCRDGNPACDRDGTKDGACTFGVGICVYQNDVAGCTPQPVNDITFPRPQPGLLNKNGTVTPPTDVTIDLPSGDSATGAFTADACGPQTLIQVFLRTKKTRRGPVEKPSRPVRLRMIATSDATPKRDVDTLKLRCLPGPPVCPANPDGGPSQLTLTVPEGGGGSDLDYGWLGTFHNNFPVTGSAQLQFCLSGCDGSSNPVCQGEGATGRGSLNGETFGAPLPLFTANTFVCVVNRFDPDPGKVVTTNNMQTGEGSGVVRLKSDIYINPALCPICSGAGLGSAGTCHGGATPGGTCIVDGTVTVQLDDGPKFFKLSRDCLPASADRIATLDLDLDLTTGTSSKSESPPCPGQAAENNCGGPCGSACGAFTDACFGLVEDPVNPGTLVCQDKKGGLSQRCCSDGATPCHPSAAEGGIVRTGRAVPPLPPWNEPGYPKSSDIVLASVFCEPPTGSLPLDAFAIGLPGPGALILPVKATYTRGP